MKKILFIGMTPNQGGMETFMINTFINLEGKNFHFEFINTSPYKPIAYSNVISRNNGTIRNVKIDDKWLTHLYRYRIAYNFFKYHHDYDIIHLNALSINSIFWLKAANKFNIKKIIMHSHNDTTKYDSKLKHFFSNLLSIKNKKYLNHNSRIIELAASSSAGKWMFNNNKFKVINNGIESKKFLFDYTLRYKIRKQLKINMSSKVLITVARLDYQKNYSKILKIFKKIVDIDYNTKLVIIGDGPDKYNVYHLVDKLSLQKYVIFLGIINNVNKVLNIADLMLMPSRYEAFPFALIESQAAGVPALVSANAIPESSNVTNTLKYLSLNETDQIWANVAINMLNKHNSDNYKIKMNQKIAESKYSITSAIKQISEIYLK